MPLCSYGQKLYDEWERYSRIIGVLDARRSMPMMTKVRPDVPFELNYEVTVQKGIEAQEKFMAHHSYCPECQKSAFG